MSDDAQYDDNDNDSDESEGLRGLRKAKNAAEARQRELEAEVAQGNADRKELAFLKANLGDSKAVSFFRQHYDGALDSDSIRAGAADAGVIPDADPAAQAALAGQAQMSAAYSGGEPATGAVTHIGPFRQEVPAEQAEMWAEYETALKGFGGAQEAAEVLRRYGHYEPGGVQIAGAPAGGDRTQPVPMSHPGYTGAGTPA